MGVAGAQRPQKEGLEQGSVRITVGNAISKSSSISVKDAKDISSVLLRGENTEAREVDFLPCDMANGRTGT